MIQSPELNNKDKFINPRTLLENKAGREILREKLIASGYKPQHKPFTAMCNAIFMATPILLEGERGGGKTAFPEALAAALGLRLFFLACLSDTTSDHILFSWDTAAQNHFVGQEIQKGISAKEAQSKQWTADFVKLGEVLAAFHYSATTGKPCVLVIDELDKLSQDAESAFLQILARGFANIPKLLPDGRIGFTPEYPAEKRRLAYPIVVSTSNNMGSGVSSPVRSRGRYAVIPAPDFDEMPEILAARVPAASPRLLFETVKLVNGISGLPLNEKPALREYIMLLETFVAYGYKTLTAEIIADNLDCLAKTKKDVSALADAVDSLFINFVLHEDKHLEELIRKIFAKRHKAV